MKSASAGLISLLNSNTQFLMADLYTITLQNGTVLRYTSADIDLTSGGNTYTHITIVRGTTRIVLGIEVDTLDINISPDSTMLVAGVGFFAAVIAGAFDNATVLLTRVFMPTWGDTSLGEIPMFSGRIADIQYQRDDISITAKSFTELFNIQMPRNLHERHCAHTVYDSGCGVVRTSYQVGSSANASSTTSVIYCGLTNAAGYFDLGKLVFTSGVNNGVTRSVKAYSPGTIVLSVPFSSAPATGDLFIIYPGCDRTQNTCSSKFNNVINFRGYPFIPNPEAAY